MVDVHLWSGLRSLTGGRDKIEVEANNVGEILSGLVEHHPELEPVIEAGVSVAVDGKIIASDLTTPVSDTSEIYLIQQLRGG